MNDSNQTTQSTKRGCLLPIGIFFLPIVFTWFTLKQGYSKLYRIVAFGWLSICVLSLIFSEPAESEIPEIPEYTVLEIINLVSGERLAEVMVPSQSRETPFETRKKTADAILEKEKVAQLHLYSTKDAMKAQYSDSFRKKHPDAIKGYLGRISSNGQFTD